VLKAAVFGHAVVQGVLARMAKRGVPQVVRQRDRLHQVLMQTQGPRQRTRQLRDLQRMGHAGAKQVALVVQKDLGFIDQAAKRGGMHDAVSVALKGVACRCIALVETPTLCQRRIAGIDSQHQRQQA